MSPEVKLKPLSKEPQFPNRRGLRVAGYIAPTCELENHEIAVFLGVVQHKNRRRFPNGKFHYAVIGGGTEIKQIGFKFPRLHLQVEKTKETVVREMREEAGINIDINNVEPIYAVEHENPISKRILELFSRKYRRRQLSVLHAFRGNSCEMQGIASWEVDGFKKLTMAEAKAALEEGTMSKEVFDAVRAAIAWHLTNISEKPVFTEGHKLALSIILDESDIAILEDKALVSQKMKPLKHLKGLISSSPQTS